MYNPAVDVVFEAEPPRSLAGTPGPYRRGDYFALPDEPRCELLWGHLVVTPAPSQRHQVTLLALSRRLYDFALANGHLVLAAPADVALFDHTVLQPDLLLVAGERRDLATRAVECAPDLVVEVLSPSTGRRDRMVKLALYARAGVPEYWIVDPEAGTVDQLVLEGDAFRVSTRDEDRLRSVRFPELELGLAAIWNEVERILTGRPPG